MIPHAHRPTRVVSRLGSSAAAFFALAACAGEAPDAMDAPGETEAPAMESAGPTVTGGSRIIVDLLADGEAVFGRFVSGMTPDAASADARLAESDFVLYSLESGEWDMERLAMYIEALDVAAEEAELPPRDVILRTPAIGDDIEGSRTRVAEALEAGVDGIVFPHAHSAAQARHSIEFLGDVWPAEPDGSLVDMLIVEDREGIAQVREIASTDGLTVVFAGPGDLRRAYDRDAEAVEVAIQEVLAACLEFDVPCGITAGVDDIAERLEQGFRVIIVTEDEALEVGRAAAGRME